MSGWQSAAADALQALADEGREFTADDLLARVGHPDPSHAPNGRNNGVGTAMRAAHRAGIIEPVGTALSRQPHRKGGMIRTWRGTATR